MTDSELKNALFKLSVKAIFKISKGSSDPIKVQELMEYISHLRPIFDCVQVMEIKNISNDEKEIAFVLSPNYLMQNYSLVMDGGLYELEWTFKLPEYFSGEEISFSDNNEVLIKSIGEDEGVAGWVARGEVEITKYSPLYTQLNTQDFFNSVLHHAGV